MRPNNYIKNLLIILGLLAIASFFAYSIVQYRKSGIEQKGVVTCLNEECFWSAHIHLNVPIEICGNKYILPKFKGPLRDLHSHGDENIVHWHDKLLYDSINKIFLAPSPFILKDTLENQGTKLDADKIFGYGNGDLCDGKKSFWKVFINGNESPDWRNYEWKDRDIILFIFDERGVEEIKEELRQKPMQFPDVAEE